MTTSTKNSFDFLVEYITTKVTEWTMHDMGIDLEEALLILHNSETFEKLCEPETEMYIESPAYVYEIFRAELRNGTLKGMSE